MADLHIHTLTVRNHRITCDSPVLVQHGMGHDAIMLDLDAEWDGLAVRLVLGPCGSAYDVLYEGEPVVVPAATLADAGWLPVSVVGYGDDGAVRVTTERCDHLLRVVESGCVEGSVPPEDAPDLLGQLVEAAERADASADAADKAAASAASAASAATEAAGRVDAAVESATKATKAATDAAASATSAAKQASDAAETAEKLAEDIPAYVTAAQQAAVEAARAASDADVSATAAGKSASAAAGSAEQADGSATAAQGSAEEASGSAKLAATSAEEAAGSAKEASGSAESAQGSAQSAQQSAAEAESWADAAQVSAGNVLTGTASGPVAHADDAYAAKPREVRVEGRTIKNLWPVINKTWMGITVSTDETGLITVSGTSTDVAYVISEEIADLPVGSSVTLTSTNYGASGLWRILLDGIGGSTVTGQFTFTAEKTDAPNRSGCVAIVVTAGQTINVSFRVMLVEGTEAPDCFTPNGVHGVEPEKLVVAGKNLVNLDGAEYVKSSSSSSATFGDDGSVTITGATDSWNGCFVELKSVVLPPGTYTTSGFTNANMWILLSAKDQLNGLNGGKYYTEKGYTYRADQNATFRIAEPSRVAFAIGDQISEGDSLTIYPQLELGSTATDYEPLQVTEVELPETDALMDGDVLTIAQDGAVSVDRLDGTTDQLGTVQTPQLPAPTFNVYATGGYVPGETGVDYERDVNIAYAELEAKIAALTVAQATS